MVCSAILLSTWRFMRTRDQGHSFSHVSTISNISSKATGPIVSKFHMVTWPTWPPHPYMVKSFKKIDQWPWNLVCSIKYSSTTKIVRMMILGWPGPFLWQGQICRKARTTSDSINAYLPIFRQITAPSSGSKSWNIWH